MILKPRQKTAIDFLIKQLQNLETSDLPDFERLKEVGDAINEIKDQYTPDHFNKLSFTVGLILGTIREIGKDE